MSERSRQMAERLRAETEEFIRVLESVASDDWNRLPEDGGWGPGKNAEHTAGGMNFHCSLVRTAGTGEPVNRPPRPAVDSRTTDLTPAQVVVRLREQLAAATALLESLTDDDLGKQVAPLRDGTQPTAEWVIHNMMIHHVAEHRDTIRQLTASTA